MAETGAASALALLGSLLDRWQRTEVERRLSLNLAGREAKPYLATSGGDREQFHAVMENAARAGSVELTWGRFAAAHELVRVVLLDGQRLADFLCRPLAGTHVAALERRLADLLATGSDWLPAVWQRAAGRWRRGESALRLRLPESSDDAVTLFKALDAVDKKQHAGLDLRTFCARYLDDSKALERLKAGFTEAWCAAHEIADWNADDLYAALGLEKSPQPVLLRGPLLLANAQAQIGLDAIQPWFGLPREALGQLGVSAVPSYVLSIENWASFSRYCREIPDRGLVLYTNGFPNPAVQEMLARLNHLLPEETLFFHWGDSDVRGLEILDFVARVCGRRVVPHLMDRQPWSRGRALNKAEHKVLERLIRSRPELAPLAKKLHEHSLPVDFEQESIKPRSPLETL